MTSKMPVVAIVGATGAVGREMIDVLTQREFPVSELRLLASARSAGTTIPFKGKPITVRELTKDSLTGVDLALFSAGSGISKAFGPMAAAGGTVVVDNSSAFRMDAGVPLVIPQVNPEAMPARVPGKGCIIAVPNCSTIIMLMAVTPLHRAMGVARIVVSTYQAASGAGAAAMDELRTQTSDVLADRPAVPRIFHEPYAFNLFCHNAPMNERTGLNGEEQKMIDETRKIWGDERVRISPTCVRVPVMRAHSEAINVTLESPATLADVRAVLAGAPGVRLVDDRAANLFPTPLKASGGDDVLIGRLREDPSQTPSRFVHGAPTIAFDMFVVGDQLRKGAALNAVQIAELICA